MKKILIQIYSVVVANSFIANLMGQLYSILPNTIQNYGHAFLNKIKRVHTYETLTISGLKIHFHIPPTKESRGVGSISKKLLYALKNIQDEQEVKKLIYFYPSLHYCPDSLPDNSVIIVHDLIPLCLRNSFSTATVYLFENNFRRIAKKARHLIAISESTKNDIVNLYQIAPDKITTVFNSVSESDLGSMKITKTENNLTYFVTLGANDPHKNISFLFELWDKYPEISENFGLITIGVKGNKNNYKSINKNIEIKGYLPKNELLNIIKNAKALLFPSLKEGFGLPPFEVALHGIPTICNDCPAMNEFLTNSAILVEANNHEKWRDAIITLADDQNLAQSLAKRAKGVALSLTIEKQSAEILQILQRFATNKDAK